MDDVTDIKALAINFYRDLFSTDLCSVDDNMVEKFLSFVPPLVTVAENEALLAPVTLEKVRKIVFLMDPDSAPGPNEFLGTFSALVGML